MENITGRITELVIKRLNNKLSRQEENELQDWVSLSDDNRLAVEDFLDEQKLNEGIKRLYRSQEKIWMRLNQQIGDKNVKSVFGSNLFKYAATAAIFILLAASSYFILNRNARKEIVFVAENKQPVNEVQPGKNKAMLTLADGTKVALDSAAAGSLAQQGTTILLNEKGKLVYDEKGGQSKGNLYNTLSTSRGEVYALVLSDGSKVWLNSASSIRFPVAFVGNQREVEITGEAYFEVAKNAAKPFRVSINNVNGKVGQIEVLGTHFNINAYNDEPDVKATLLEGAVKVKMGNAVQMLASGQQASLRQGGIALQKNVDVSQVVAWKEGFFLFDKTDLQSLMRQIARWYDVEVNFAGKVKEDSFSGKISRSLPLSKFLKVLDLNDVHVKIEGKTITVGP